MVTYKEFKIDDLFDVAQGRRLKKSDFQDGDIPFVMASSKNNGVVAYLSNPVTTNTNFITADILGNVFYQDGLVGYGDDNCGLKLKNGHESEAVYLYLTTVISKFKPMASYGNKLRGKWYAEQVIQLPVKQGTDDINYSEANIDWDYMEQYIREIELAYIAELEETRDREIAAYLQNSGLLVNYSQENNIALTLEDQTILNTEPTFGEFKVGDLLDCETTRNYNPKKVSLPEGNTPYVTRSAFNNGITGYFNDESEVYLNDGNCITIGAEGGVAFYQPDDFIAGVKVYTLRHERMTCEIGLYLCTVLNVYSHIYSYTNARVLDKIKNEIIKLPLKPSTDITNVTEDDIDWDYMEAYIRAIEKQVITDVVTYKDTFIAKAKEIVN